ncbi:enoyl-CoA hydratase-related protein [Paracoccus beibuensis]|uniref:enoyl-CoA hydratase-related protein n=1 Tax=Paracoccus beibuensis TaxID=547602 RepID=UPI00223FCDE0|nr:enoyl-CoA hydratase-related protein [Paracoccus beibuensis]
MALSTIRFTVEDGVGTLALNRPSVMNALNRQMRHEITQMLIALPDEVRCAVLTGIGRGFCCGQDLTDGATGADLEALLRDEYEPMLRAICDCPAPVIAAVNGVAAGAGANLALSADVVIATESASFIQAFTRIGLIPDAGGTWIMPRAVGMARAMGMMLFAEPVTARQAEEWGLIWQALPDDVFAAAAADRAQALAKGPTGAFIAIRQALATSFGNSLEAQLAVEAQLQGQAGQSHDFAEGVAAFLEKRRPVFTGH